MHWKNHHVGSAFLVVTGQDRAAQLPAGRSAGAIEEVHLKIGLAPGGRAKSWVVMAKSSGSLILSRGFFGNGTASARSVRGQHPGLLRSDASAVRFKRQRGNDNNVSPHRCGSGAFPYR